MNLFEYGWAFFQPIQTQNQSEAVIFHQLTLTEVPGVDLSTVATKINKACVFMKDASHKQTLLFVLLMQGTVKILSGI
jgi:hypothetical protein